MRGSERPAALSAGTYHPLPIPGRPSGGWFRWAGGRENHSVVLRMPMYPGPPPGCVPGGLDMSSGSPAYDPHHGGIPPVASLRARDPSDGWGGGAGRTGLGLEPAGTPH